MSLPLKSKQHDLDIDSPVCFVFFALPVHVIRNNVLYQDCLIFSHLFLLSGNPKPSSTSGCWSVVLPDSPQPSTSAAAVDTAQTTETASPPARQSRFVEDGELPSTSTAPQPGNLRVHLHCLDPISGELFACVVIYYLLDVCYTVKFASFTQKHYFSSILQNYCRI